MLSGNVLVTGGAGFLGRAILRRAHRENWPARFTVYSRDETKQWDLKHRYPAVRCVLGDISRDLDHLTAAMAGHDTVIHAAAVKYIPEAEFNVSETIDVNVIGSRNIAIAARAAGVKTVVGISTDKACAPLNLYGASKMVMERYFAEANRMGSTRFVTVRYGNVAASTGSVIPVFKRQIEEFGEIRVTDASMTRFWLSVDAAVDLICFAFKAAEACPGYTIIDQCPAMKIVDLAAAVWRMEKGDASRTTREVPEPNIRFTGIRPGEKLHEMLYNEQEAPRISRNDKYFLMQPATVPAGAEGLAIAPSYSSDKPRKWLTQEQMIAIIRDAADV